MGASHATLSYLTLLLAGRRYVDQPSEPAVLASQSFHKAMWQLVRKRTKGKTARHSNFPPGETVFAEFVNHRLRAAHMELGMRGDKLRK